MVYDFTAQTLTVELAVERLKIVSTRVKAVAGFSLCAGMK